MIAHHHVGEGLNGERAGTVEPATHAGGRRFDAQQDQVIALARTWQQRRIRPTQKVTSHRWQKHLATRNFAVTRLPQTISQRQRWLGIQINDVRVGLAGTHDLPTVIERAGAGVLKLCAKRLQGAVAAIALEASCRCSCAVTQSRFAQNQRAVGRSRRGRNWL